MQTYIALLRGINVSGKNKIAMPELKKALSTPEILNVRTYIQSGNVAFETEETNEDVLIQNIQKRISDSFGLQVPVIIRSRSELVRIHESNLFSNDTSKLYITFLHNIPGVDLIKAAQLAPSNGDEFVVLGREIYLMCHSGYGTTKLNNTFFEKKLKTTATTRNWNTVNIMGDF